MTGIERLRSMAARHNFLEPEEARKMWDIADQIERETEEQSARLYDERVGEETGVCELFGVEPVDDPLTSLRRHVENLNDTIENLRLELGEQSDAIAWVREHGGIEHVRQQWGYLRGRANHADHVDRQLVKRQRQIDESHAALRRRNERIGFLVSELNRANHENREMFMRRAGDYTAFADEVCKRLASELRYVEGCSKDVMDAALHALDRRLMPEGMEWLLDVWPKWSNGEYCKFGDWWKADEYSERGPNRLIRLSIYTPEQLREWEQDEGENYGYEWNFMRPANTTYRPNKVEPPAPKVLDADGAEIRVGDTVWTTRDLDKFTVTDIEDEKFLRVVCKGEDEEEYRVHPDNLTHRAPVLAADGKPLLEGEKPYRVDNGKQVEIRRIDPSNGESCVFVGVDGRSYGYWLRPGQLTHQRPESKCRDCAHWQKDPTADNMGVCWFYYHEHEGQDCYAARRADIGACEEFMPRAKALAERDA